MKPAETVTFSAADTKAGMTLGEVAQAAFTASDRMGNDTEVVADISFRGRIKRLTFSTK